MSNQQSWRPPFAAMCPAPGPSDVFLVIFIDGKRVAIQPADEYDKWRYAAERLACEEKVQVKVLPMGGSEMMNFFNIKPAPPTPIETTDPEFRKQATQTFFDVLRDSQHPHERDMALTMLRQLGALNV